MRCFPVRVWARCSSEACCVLCEPGAYRPAYTTERGNQSSPVRVLGAAAAAAGGEPVCVCAAAAAAAAGGEPVCVLLLMLMCIRAAYTGVGWKPICHSHGCCIGPTLGPDKRGGGGGDAW